MPHMVDYTGLTTKRGSTAWLAAEGTLCRFFGVGSADSYSYPPIPIRVQTCCTACAEVLWDPQGGAGYPTSGLALWDSAYGARMSVACRLARSPVPINRNEDRHCCFSLAWLTRPLRPEGKHGPQLAAAIATQRWWHTPSAKRSWPSLGKELCSDGAHGRLQ